MTEAIDDLFNCFDEQPQNDESASIQKPTSRLVCLIIYIFCCKIDVLAATVLPGRV